MLNFRRELFKMDLCVFKCENTPIQLPVSSPSPVIHVKKLRLHCHTPHKSLDLFPPATPVCSLQGLHGPHGEPRAEHGAAGEGRAGRDPGPAHLLHEEPRHQTESRPAGELHHQSAPEQPSLSSLTHLQTHIHTHRYTHRYTYTHKGGRRVWRGFVWGGTPF